MQTCWTLSKKFTSSQQHYRAFKQEFLAILEALKKWKDKLFNGNIIVVTHHKALTVLKTQGSMSIHPWRWWEYTMKNQAFYVVLCSTGASK